MLVGVNGLRKNPGLGSTQHTSKAGQSCSLAVWGHSSPETKNAFFLQNYAEGMPYSFIPAGKHKGKDTMSESQEDRLKTTDGPRTSCCI